MGKHAGLLYAKLAILLYFYINQITKYSILIMLFCVVYNNLFVTPLLSYTCLMWSQLSLKKNLYWKHLFKVYSFKNLIKVLWFCIEVSKNSSVPKLNPKFYKFSLTIVFRKGLQKNVTPFSSNICSYNFTYIFVLFSYFII